VETHRPRSKSSIQLLAIAVAIVSLLVARPARPAPTTAFEPFGPGASEDLGASEGYNTAPGASEGYNTAWSGWIDVADAHVAFRSVAATFTVPAVTCSAPGAGVGLWVGMDGYPHGNPTIEQVGVGANCVQSVVNGTYPTYFAWYQMGPGLPVLRRAVAPGDVITASVSYDGSARRYDLDLTDAGRPGADIRASLPCPPTATCHDSSAEVIAEDPDGGYSDGISLANFGVADFRHVAVTSAEGTAGTLAATASWHVQGEAVVNASDNVVAQPSGPADGSTAFSVAFTPDLVLVSARPFLPAEQPKHQP
jgi:hypothetical protein